MKKKAVTMTDLIIDATCALKNAGFRDDQIDMIMSSKQPEPAPQVASGPMQETISRKSALAVVRYLQSAGQGDLILDALHILHAAGQTPITDMTSLRTAHAAWSERQFGDVSAVGPAKHLAKEALEVADAPNDAMEHADLEDAIGKKLAANMHRDWPDPQEGEPREHISPLSAFDGEFDAAVKSINAGARTTNHRFLP